MRTAVDTNVLLDIVTGDERFFERAVQALSRAVQSGTAIVSPIVYAELGVHFAPMLSDLDLFLREIGVTLDSALPADTLTVAARAWRVYLQQRGQQGQCPQCGLEFDVICPRCERHMPWRQHMLADFLIGAHALTRADTLLTRDRPLYQSYFADLPLTTFDASH